MACIVGFGSFRYEEVDHPIGIRIIGRTGRQARQLSRAASFVFSKARSRNEGLRWLRAVIDVLNVLVDVEPAVDDVFVRSVPECRRMQHAWLCALGVPTQDTGDGDGSVWLSPAAKVYRRVSDGLIALGKVTAALVRAGVFPNDPSKVDLHLSRRARKGKGSSDVDRLLRLGADPTLAPRFDDPRFHERLIGALVATGADPVFGLMVDLARRAGPRAFQVLELTLHDVFVSPRKHGIIDAPNKRSRGERTMELIPVTSVYDRIIAWIATERAARSGCSIERIRLMAADPAQAALLKGMPLFTEDGATGIVYDRLYRIVRRAAGHGDLFINDEAYRVTGVRRFVTFHYLRHEYVHGRLDEIFARPEGERDAQRKALIAYMRWSPKAGPKMLRWYSAHHMVKIGARCAEEHNANVDSLTMSGLGDFSGQPAMRSEDLSVYVDAFGGMA